MSRLLALLLAGLAFVAAQPSAAQAVEQEGPPSDRNLLERTAPEFPGAILPPPTFPEPDPYPWDRRWWPPKPIPVPLPYPRPWPDPFGPSGPVIHPILFRIG